MPQEMVRNLDGANLEGANFDEAILDGGFFARANLRNASLKKAFISEAGFEESNLINVDFSESDLSGSHFNDADITGAILAHAKLVQTVFERAKLIKADLSHATGMETGMFGDAIMKGATLKGVLIPYPSTFQDVELTGADLEGAILNPDKLEGIIGRPATLPPNNTCNPDPLQKGRFQISKTP